MTQPLTPPGADRFDNAVVFDEAELVRGSFASLIRFLDAAHHRRSWEAQVEVEFGARLPAVGRVGSFQPGGTC